MDLRTVKLSPVSPEDFFEAQDYASLPKKYEFDSNAGYAFIINSPGFMSSDRFLQDILADDKISSVHYDLLDKWGDYGMVTSSSHDIFLENTGAHERFAAQAKEYGVLVKYSRSQPSRYKESIFFGPHPNRKIKPLIIKIPQRETGGFSFCWRDLRDFPNQDYFVAINDLRTYS